MRSVDELHRRIKEIYELGDRLDRVDHFKRLWVADYAANADVVADCLLEILNGGAVPPPCPECSAK